MCTSLIFVYLISTSFLLYYTTTLLICQVVCRILFVLFLRFLRLSFDFFVCFGSDFWEFCEVFLLVFTRVLFGRSLMVGLSKRPTSRSILLSLTRVATHPFRPLVVARGDLWAYGINFRVWSLEINIPCISLAPVKVKHTPFPKDQGASWSIF